MGAPLSALPDEQTLAALLGREAVNGFGVMAATPPGAPRRLRGSGIYPFCSRINNACFPNVARFDDFDSVSTPPPSNTAIRIRAIEPIPKGSEILLAYCKGLLLCHFSCPYVPALTLPTISNQIDRSGHVRSYSLRCLC